MKSLIIYLSLFLIGCAQQTVKSEKKAHAKKNGGTCVRLIKGKEVIDSCYN